MRVVERSQHICAACGHHGDLVRAGLVLVEVGAGGPRPGEQDWFHRRHLPPGWRVGAVPPMMREQ
jgi:hypothetical protein